MIKFYLIWLSVFLFTNFSSAQTVNLEKNDTLLVVKKILIKGNKKTKTKIIERELSLKENDTISKRSLIHHLEQSKKNLLNTPLFNFVYFEPEIANNELTLTVEVEERWYLWPFLVFDFADRNFNEWWETRNLKRLYYGVMLTKYNFRGRNEKLDFTFTFGYKQLVMLEYSNIYLDEARKHAFSFKIYSSKQNEVQYLTQNNKPQFLKLGLDAIYKKQVYSWSYTYRPKVFTQFKICASYANIHVKDTVIKINPEYYSLPQKTFEYLKFELQYTIDKRDAKYYPLKGYSYEGNLFTTGFLEKNSTNFSCIQSSISGFTQLANRLFAASFIKARYAFQENKSYIFREAIGYKDNLRGYEYYLIDGSHFMLFKSNLKFTLVKPRVKTMKFMRFEKFKKAHFAFYSNLYFDAGYASTSSNVSNNSFQNRLLYSGGIGIDFVTYYDKVLRVEYSINHLGEKGIFIHFVAPI